MGRLIVWLIAFFQRQEDDVTELEDRLEWIVRWLNKNRNWLVITGILITSLVTDPYGFISTVSCELSKNAIGWLPNHPENLTLVYVLSAFDEKVPGIGSGLALEFLGFLMPAIALYPFVRAIRKWI